LLRILNRDMQIMFAEMTDLHVPWMTVGDSIRRISPCPFIETGAARSAVREPHRQTDVCEPDAVDRGYRFVVVADELCGVSDESRGSLLALRGDQFSQQIEVADSEEIPRCLRLTATPATARG
jgi:hypothetical protein